jgi:hypothetical protein
MTDVMERVRAVLSRPCADCGTTPALVLWQDKETRLCRSCSSIRHGYEPAVKPQAPDIREQVLRYRQEWAKSGRLLDTIPPFQITPEQYRDLLTTMDQYAVAGVLSADAPTTLYGVELKIIEPSKLYTEVTIVGGPEDGKVYAVRPGDHSIAFPKLRDMQFSYGDADTIVAFDQIILPIQRTADGRHFVEWPED